MAEEFDTLDEAPHSTFAPSASDGWMVCADYINANRGKPDTAGIDAATGTRFHSLMQHALLNPGFRPKQWLGQEEIIQAGQKHYLIKVDQEMVDCAVDCLKWVSGIDGDVYVETRADFSDLTPIPNQKGTCDLAICQYGRLRIRDWKYGKGHWVSPVDNRQLRIYAYGFFREWDWLYNFREIEIGIGQPRLENFETWTIGRDDILAFAEEVREAAAKANRPNQPRTPTEKGCRWCKDVACAARKALLESMTDGVFEDLDMDAANTVSRRLIRVTVSKPDLTQPRNPPNPNDLSTTQLSFLYRHRKLYEAWFNAIGQELVARAESDDVAADMKLVVSRTKTAIGDKSRYVDILRSAGVPDTEIWFPKLVSPANALKSIRKYKSGVTKKAAGTMLAPAVFKPPGKHTLVHISDNREAVKSLSEDSFVDLDSSSLVDISDL